jgi:hypothetical protein
MTRWAQADVDAVIARQKNRLPDGLPPQSPEPKTRRKYGNTPWEVNGEKFASKHEAECWVRLRARAAMGEITHLERQVAIPLFAGTPSGVRVPVCDYVADFVYRVNHQRVIADAKSVATKKDPVYQLKRKWLLAQDGIAILEM